MIKKGAFWAILFAFAFVACEKDEESVNKPTLNTTELASITSSSVISGGDVSSDGGSEVTARGVCWDLVTNPTIELSTKTSDGRGQGTFVSSISDLEPNTTYYVRAYATNEAGTSYGNERSFMTTDLAVTDIDGNTYGTVEIGDQVWMKDNLNVSHYRNGDEIPQVTSLAQWVRATEGAWCYYASEDANGVKYGKLYNWYAVNDPRGLAPEGWHIASNAEWKTLIDFLGGASIAGGALKSTEGWNSPNTGATNSSGFTAIPGGGRQNDGNFNFLGSLGLWWTADIDRNNKDLAWYYVVYNNSTVAEPYHMYFTTGLAVRCVKD